MNEETETDQEEEEEREKIRMSQGRIMSRTKYGAAKGP